MDVISAWQEWSIEELLGEGAYGKVYKAKRVERNKEYFSAIKIIEIPQSQAEINDAYEQGMNENEVKEYFEGYMEDLISEIDMMNSLKGGKNIVVIEDYKVIEKQGSIGWTIYVRMELLNTFAQVFEQAEVISEELVVRLGIDICGALETCQTCNVIHRDIKPGNIFVSKFGEFKLGDFGVARQLERTSSGLSKKGTYFYMAPEVYKGEEYNHTVDIYSLGIMMYRLLNNNRLPFLPPYPEKVTYKDRENALTRRISGEAMPALPTDNEELARIILKACAYDYKDRYASAEEMRTDLQKLEAIITEATGKTVKDVLDFSNKKTNIGMAVMASDTNEKVATANTAPAIQEQEIKQIDSIDTVKEITEGNKNNVAVNVSVYDVDSAEDEITVDLHNYDDAGDERTVSIYGGQQQAMPMVQEDTQEKKSSKKPLLIFLLLLILIGAGVAIAIYKNSSEDEDVVSNNTTSATTDLLTATITDDTPTVTTTEDIPTATTTQQVPTVTQTEDIVVVPTEETTKMINAVGRNINEVIEEMSGLGIKYILAEVYNDEAAGTVISQSVTADTEVDENTQVVLTMSKGKKPVVVPDKIAVPSVIGETSSNAKNILKKKGFVVIVEEEYSTTVAKDNVISQSIKAKTMLEKGSSIGIIVSKGKPIEKIVVPNVIKKIAQLEMTSLKNTGFIVKIVEESSSDVPKGLIIRQSLAAGTSVDKGSTLTLYVSKGAMLITVPNVIKKTSEQATTILEGLGFVVTYEEYYSEHTEAGYVLNQSPAANTQLEKGSTVLIAISKGIQLEGSVYVPNVVGMSASSAVSSLESIGLKVVVTELINSEAADGVVYRQSKSVGELVKKDTTIEISVSLGAPWISAGETFPTDYNTADYEIRCLATVKKYGAWGAYSKYTGTEPAQVTISREIAAKFKYTNYIGKGTYAGQNKICNCLAGTTSDWQLKVYYFDETLPAVSGAGCKCGRVNSTLYGYNSMQLVPEGNKNASALYVRYKAVSYFGIRRIITAEPTAASLGGDEISSIKYEYRKKIK